MKTKRGIRLAFDNLHCSTNWSFLRALSAQTLALSLVSVCSCICVLAASTPPATASNADLVIVKGQDSPTITMAWSPDGKLLAVASSGGGKDAAAAAIKLWDVVNGCELKSWTCQDRVRSLSFSSDGWLLAGVVSGDKANEIKVWGIPAGTDVRTIPVDCRLGCISFSPDGKLFATGGDGNAPLRLWSLDTASEIGQFKDPGNPIQGDVPVAFVVFSPDGNYLASSDSRYTRLWKVAGCEFVRAFEHEPGVPRNLIFSSDSKTLSQVLKDKCAVLDLESGREVANYSHRTLDGNATSVADGSTAGALLDGSIAIWETKSGSGLRIFPGYSDTVPPESGSRKEYGLGRVISIDKLHKKVAAGFGNHVCVWDADANKPEPSSSFTTEHQVSSIAFSPNGETLINGNLDGTIEIRNASNWNTNKLIRAHEDVVYCVSFTQDCKYFASCSLDGNTKIWDKSGELVRTIPAKAKAVRFSPDGSLLGALQVDNRVSLWNCSSGEPAGEVVPEAMNVNAIEFSPDSSLLMLAGSAIKVTAGAAVTKKTVTKTQPPAVKRQASELPKQADDLAVAVTAPPGGLAEQGVGFGSEGATTSLPAEVSKDPRGSDAPNEVASTVPVSCDLKAPRGESAAKTGSGTARSGRKVGTHRDSSQKVQSSESARASEGVLQLWQLSDKTLVRELRTRRAPVKSLSYRDSGSLYCLGNDGSLLSYDTATWLDRPVLTGAAEVGAEELRLDPSIAELFIWKHKTIGIYNCVEGKEERSLNCNAVSPALSQDECDARVVCKFSPDGQTLATSWNDTVRLWSVISGKETQVFRCHSNPLSSLALFGKSGLESIDSKGHACVWNMSLGTMQGASNSEPATAACLSPDQTLMAVATADRSIRLRDLSSNKDLWVVPGAANGMSFSADSKALVTSEPGKTVTRDVSTGKVLRSFDHSESELVAFTADGSKVATVSKSQKLAVTNLNTDEQLCEVMIRDSRFKALALSSDGSTVAAVVATSVTQTDHSGGETQSFSMRLFDAATGAETGNLALSSEPSSVATNAGNQVAIGYQSGAIELRQLNSEKVVVLKKHTGAVRSLAFADNGRFLVSGSSDATIRFWSPDGQELATLVSVDGSDWAVVSPEGNFDASFKGAALTHFRIGKDIVDLTRLRYGYFEPHLLPKLLGFNSEPVARPKVTLPQSLPPPEVSVLPPGKGDAVLIVKVKDRGGGIGQVQVRVNGRLIDPALVPGSSDPSASDQLIIVDLLRVPKKEGDDNSIAVCAFDKSNSLVSGESIVNWQPPGSRSDKPPEFYAIIAGISLPRQQDANQPADAELTEIVKTVTVAGKRFFGDDKVHVTVLSEAQRNSTTDLKRTVAELFNEARNNARPADTLFVYLAEESDSAGVLLAPKQAATSVPAGATSVPAGVSSQATAAVQALTAPTAVQAPTPGQASAIEQAPAGGLAPEPTPVQAAVQTSATGQTLSQTVAGTQVAKPVITEEDLSRWSRNVACMNQAFIFDCKNSSQANTANTPPSDLIRSMNKLQDTTGATVLLRFGRGGEPNGFGILPFALVKSMRSVNGNIEIERLFGTVTDEVAQLTRRTSSAFVSEVFRPVFARSQPDFCIGKLTKEDQAVLPPVRCPVVIKPMLLDRSTLDPLALSTSLMIRVRDLNSDNRPASTQTSANIHFADAQSKGDTHDSINATGAYKLSGDRVTVSITLAMGSHTVQLPELTGNRMQLETLSDEIIAAIQRGAEEMASQR